MALSAVPKGGLLPHATITHKPTIKTLQTTKITELGLLPLHIGFEKKVQNIRNEKQIHILPTWKTIPGYWMGTLMS